MNKKNNKPFKGCFSFKKDKLRMNKKNNKPFEGCLSLKNGINKIKGKKNLKMKRKQKRCKGAF
jgi:hypothetical protein